MVKKQDLHPQVKLMIASSADRKGPSFGKGAATLLHGIEENGSLNKTAKDLHMAYSKAWSMIKKVEEGLGFTGSGEGISSMAVALLEKIS